MGIDLFAMKTIKIIKRVEKTTRRMGIFWIHQGKILASSCSREAGEEYGDSINGPVNHAHFWPQLQDRFFSCL